ncbi:hypothetical protein E2C01_101643 [Portunus trituberculatus]|uniref:Uncharacterized protein n=1 Tax=Portunus trituberculatus TaxID=210409 RepID=A0A5B7KB87_PORTR|nr:hypothetical protein [Portunus trituberculatus]
MTSSQPPPHSVTCLVFPPQSCRQRTDARTEAGKAKLGTGLSKPLYLTSPVRLQLPALLPVLISQEGEEHTHTQAGRQAGRGKDIHRQAGRVDGRQVHPRLTSPSRPHTLACLL